jgi:hypothetical protein
MPNPQGGTTLVGYWQLLSWQLPSVFGDRFIHNPRKCHAVVAGVPGFIKFGEILKYFSN